MAQETILLVEDEPAVRQLFATALTRAGYKVFEARNGEEAVKLFDQHGDSVDLLLTDMRMPYMGRGELAKTLRQRKPGLKLICISGCAGSLETETTKDFLAKPFSRDEILRKNPGSARSVIIVRSKRSDRSSRSEPYELCRCNSQPHRRRHRSQPCLLS
jgi:CheY-like chemotaxis protein